MLVGASNTEVAEGMRRTLFRWTNFSILYNPNCPICVMSYGQGCVANPTSQACVANQSSSKEIIFLCHQHVQEIGNPNNKDSCMNCTWPIEKSDPLGMPYVTFSYKKHYKLVHLNCFQWVHSAISFGRVIQYLETTNRERIDRNHKLRWRDLLDPSEHEYLKPLRIMDCRYCVYKNSGCHTGSRSWLCAQHLYA